MYTVRIPTGLDPGDGKVHEWDYLKVDFVQDPYEPWHPASTEQSGFPWRHLSQSDIYFRKVMIGMEGDPNRPETSVGADRQRGRRTERDIIDLACLSRSGPCLCKFVTSLYRRGKVSAAQIERSLTWWRSFPRDELMSRLLDFPLPGDSLKAGKIYRNQLALFFNWTSQTRFPIF